MKGTRRKNIDKGEQQPKRKMKISVQQRKRSSSTEEEGNYANIDYFNKLSYDVITSLFLRCTLKSLSMLRCTSKLWNNFIISSSFLHLHLTQSTENGPKLLFLERISLFPAKSSRLQFVSIDMDGSREELYTVTVPDDQLDLPECKYALGWFAFQQIVIFICAILPCNNCVNCRNIHFLLPLDTLILGLHIFTQGRNTKWCIFSIPFLQ